MEQGRDGGRDGRRGAWRVGGSALAPRLCWVCRLGQAPGCSSAFPALPAGAGAGLELSPGHCWGVPTAPARPGGSPLCPRGFEGLLDGKAPPGLEKPEHGWDGSWASGSRLAAAFSLVLGNSPAETISSAPKP